MTAGKTLKIVFPEAGITREELEIIERVEERRKDRPKALPLKDIHVAPQVFQWRIPDADLMTREAHVKDLITAIKHGANMEPLLVVPIGNRFFVVDGHHRWSAYTSMGWKQKIPVKVFDGNLADAEIAALDGNNESKLPLTPEERNEAAWRLNKQKKPDGDYVLSKVQTARKAGIGTTTVARQRAVLEKLGERAGAMMWREARRSERDEGDEDRYGDAWREEKAQEIAKAIMKAAAGVNLSRNPDIMAVAIEKVSTGLVRGLVEQWREHEETMDGIEELGI